MTFARDERLGDGDKAKGYDDEHYQQARKRRHELGATLGIDYALEQNQLDVLVFPYKGKEIRHVNANDTILIRGSRSCK